MNRGRLLKERYFYDDHDSGLIFDTYPIFPQNYSDADKLEAAINEAGLYLTSVQASGQDCMPTLHALPSQLNKIESKWQAFAAKSYIMYYQVPRKDVYEIDIFPWNAYGRDTFLWNGSPNEVYSKYDADGLAYRFRRLSAREADDLLTSLEELPPDNGEGSIPGDGGSVVVQEFPNHVTGIVETEGLFGSRKTHYVDLWLSKDEEA